MKLYFSFSPSEDTQQKDVDVINILYELICLLITRVDFYLMLNNIEVEDLGITKEEFTIDVKRKFISNCNSQLMEGIRIIKEMFLILGVLVFFAHHE